MSRGGFREKAGRKSGWNNPDTQTIRVPVIFAERLLELAHAMDSGDLVEIVTKSKKKDDSVSKSKGESLNSDSKSEDVCPNCGAVSWRIEGYRTLQSGQRKQKRRCRACDRMWSVLVA